MSPPSRSHPPAGTAAPESSPDIQPEGPSRLDVLFGALFAPNNTLRRADGVIVGRWWLYSPRLAHDHGSRGRRAVYIRYIGCLTGRTSRVNALDEPMTTFTNVVDGPLTTLLGRGWPIHHEARSRCGASSWSTNAAFRPYWRPQRWCGAPADVASWSAWRPGRRNSPADVTARPTRRSPGWPHRAGLSRRGPGCRRP
jgi:hypothetical protein